MKIIGSKDQISIFGFSQSTKQIFFMSLAEYTPVRSSGPTPVKQKKILVSLGKRGRQRTQRKTLSSVPQKA